MCNAYITFLYFMLIICQFFFGQSLTYARMFREFERIRIRNGLLVYIYIDSEYCNIQIMDKYTVERLINGDFIHNTTLYIRTKNRNEHCFDRHYFNYENQMNVLYLDLIGCQCDFNKYTLHKGVLKVYLKIHKPSMCEKLKDIFFK